MGAYESALHVRWFPPPQFRAGLSAAFIQAIPVAREPTPFWIGDDAAAHFARWRAEAGAVDTWGYFESAPASNNGSSGRWVRDNVFRVLRTQDETLSDWYFTDCLDYYCMSDGDLSRRLSSNYGPFADDRRLHREVLPPHPSEEEIVALVDADRLKQLRAQLDAVRPEVVVTLGNAALYVLHRLTDGLSKAGPRRLSPERDYGRPLRVSIGDRAVDWFPLVHPGVVRFKANYRSAHNDWLHARVGSG
ncbi:MAG: hypothetical protein ACHREM_08195 [Polyangiales bacterium]